MKSIKQISIVLIGFLIVLACKEKKHEAKSIDEKKRELIIQKITDSIINNPPEGMVWIPSGTFMQGAVPQDKMAMSHEKPQHPVSVEGFFIDITEVTNAQFSKFIEETAYVTVAEREINWEDMKKQLPEGTPKPHDSIMQPGSLTFKKTKLMDYAYFLKDISLYKELIIGVIVIYIIIITLTRIIGLKSFSKMSSYDFAHTIAVGSLIAASIGTGSPSLFVGVVLIALMFLIKIFV